MESVYKPPLKSEGDTQFFSKEFTSVEILNPEDAIDGHDDLSPAKNYDELAQEL